MKVDVMICTRDRPIELAILLSSLLNQTYKSWNLIIADGSKQSMQGVKAINDLIGRIKLEGHGVWWIKDEGNGVCVARNKILKENPFKSEYYLRIDDDGFCVPDYIRKLVLVADSGFDAVGGIVPVFGQPEFTRNIDKIEPIVNEIKYSEKGDIILPDELGYHYEDTVLPAHHLRSSFLVRKKVHDTIGGYELGLGRTGWREETYFCLKMAYAGYNMSVNTGAIAYHLQSHEGGVRDQNYASKLNVLEEKFILWARWMYKKFGNPYEENYNPKKYIKYIRNKDI